MQLNPITKLKDNEPNAYFTIDGVDNRYFELIITDLKENHSEGVDIVNPMADDNFSFTMGAMPINVSISGFVYNTKTYNQRDILTKKYEEELRGTRNKVINFIYKDIIMRLKILSVNVNTSRNIEDLTAIHLEGTGFKYDNFTLEETS